MSARMAESLLANRYRIVKSLGEGAMGRVYHVEDTITGRDVALKAIARQHAQDERSILRFKQEFRLMARLRHANCCEVYDFGLLDDGLPFFTMELVAGQGLDQLGVLPAARVRALVAQILLALDHLHEQGLVHRDIKPSNVRLRPDGVVKLMDYGLMETAGRTFGAIDGTVPYVAPEVVRRGPIDARADLYAVGCLAYELLTGQPPFVAERPIDVLRAHALETPVPPSQRVADLDPATEAFVLQLLEKDPVARFSCAFRALEALGVAVAPAIGGLLLASPLVGRESEVALLSDTLDALVSSRRGGALLLHGAAGVGKSRLVTEFRFQALLANVPCALAQSGERTPYGVVTAVLRALLPAMRAHAATALAEHGETLGQLLPELTAAGPTRARDRAELHQAIVAVMHALASAKGLVAILEDWQWADPQSVAALEYLLEQLKDAPVLWVLTSRFGPEGSPAWMGAVQSRALGPLDGEGVARIVKAMLGTEEVAAGFIAQITRLTEGNPFFVESLVEHLTKRGILRYADGHWQSALAIDPEVLPPNLQAVLHDKLRGLPGSAQAIAAISAVANQTLDLDFLRRVSELAEEQLFDALGALQSRQILYCTDTGDFRFSREEFKELLYAQLNAEERLALHQAIAEALEWPWRDVAIAARPLEVVTAIADHALQGAFDALAVPHALEAGIRHRALFAFKEAERFLKAGLALVGPDAPARCDFLCHLGGVRLAAGNQEAAAEAFRLALPLATARGDWGLVGRMWGSLGLASLNRQDAFEALACCDRAVAAAAHAPDLETRCIAHLTRAKVRLYAGALGDARDDAEQALAIAEAQADDQHLGEALGLRGYLLLAAEPERHLEGLAALQAAIMRLHRAGDRGALKDAYNWLGSSYLSSGDFPAAEEAYRRAQAVCEELGHTSDYGIRALNLAIVAFERGDCAAMRSHAAAAHRVASESGNKFQRGLAVALAACAASLLGQLPDPSSIFDEAIATASALQNRFMARMIARYEAESLLHLHRLDDAHQAIVRFEQLTIAQGHRDQRAIAQVLSGELAFRRGHHAEADRLFEAALAAASHAKGVRARALTGRAAIALATGNWELAAAWAEEARTIAGLAGTRQHQADALALLGEWALAIGQDALGPFGEMKVLAEAMGCSLRLAIASFGLAAARPYAPDAIANVGLARRLFEGLTRQWPPAAQAAFLTPHERARAYTGNHIGFSLPRGGRRPAEPAFIRQRGFWRAID